MINRLRNLCSAVTAVLLLYFLRLNAGSNPLKTQSAGRFIWSLDPLGLSLFVGAITCCLIALEVRGQDDFA
jgi:hypothetical protein